MKRTRVKTESGLTVLQDGRTHLSGLIPDWVFGPVDSRRYGRSLGINPFPKKEKVCSFDCPYCECGWTTRLRQGSDPSLDWPGVDLLVETVKTALSTAREHGETIDAVTFAGNGEPTLHPEFHDLTEEILRLRDEYASTAKIIVLTNGTELGRESVWNALLKADEACFKLDAGPIDLLKKINLPHGKVSFEKILGWLEDFPDPIVQTMFVAGTVDNTSEEDIREWLRVLKKIRPVRVDLYSLDRAAPDPGLEKVPRETLESIAQQARDRLRVPVEVY